MWLEAAGEGVGGLGLFLLGMWLMTSGLKLAAGRALERILGEWTRTRVRGLVAGVLITSIVQSSSAITVAAIGFVNAGLLSFRQSIWVLFGANVGTTMTGWLVALVGFNFKIEAFALPLLGIGMLMRFSGEMTRTGALGTAVAGFGGLFLGIEFLRESFADLAFLFSPTTFAATGVFSGFVYVMGGILLTVAMQSSSAALAVALSAAGGGLIPVTSGAALVIGANVGTTVTAVFAAIGATANARRAAGAHVLFNLLTGAVALLLLPWLVAWIDGARRWLDPAAPTATTLALFHTAFNVLGVLLMWPLADRLISFLQSRFRTADEDAGNPQHLDANVAAVPTLALDALVLELRRIGTLSLRMAVDAARRTSEAPAVLAPRKAAVDRLVHAVGEFAARLHRATMLKESSERLPEVLRVGRYYDAVAGLATQVASHPRYRTESPMLDECVARFEDDAVGLFARADTSDPGFDLAQCEDGLRAIEEEYQALKARLLEAGADGSVSFTDMDGLLEVASLIRRALQQAVKAARRLAGASRQATTRGGAANDNEPQTRTAQSPSH